jgi:hypothetical protein
MNIAGKVEQNFMYTSGAVDMGRGQRTSLVKGRPEETPGPGAHAIYKEVPDMRKGRQTNDDEQKSHMMGLNKQGGYS